MSAGSASHTLVSLFSGLGGLDLGFEWAGFKIIWANDVLPNAVSSYGLNFRIRPVCADINEIDWAQIPEADVIVGGPPCQSFSLVGQRKTDDPRGTLVFRFYDVVDKLRPQAFVMENVPGMSASRIDNVPLPEVLGKKFERIGYRVNLMNLLATDYLVPQRRARIVIAGSRRKMPKKPDGMVFAKECYNLDIKEFDISAKAAIGDLGHCVRKGELAHYRSGANPSSFAAIMRSCSSETVSYHECPRMSDTDKQLVQVIPPGGNYRNIPDSIATARMLKFKKTGGRTTTYGRLHPDRPAFTINTYFRRPNVGCHFHYSEPRLITVREAMRFQSIPDHFALAEAAQDSRNALVGNAVPPLMAQAIAWSLSSAL